MLDRKYSCKQTQVQLTQRFREMLPSSAENEKMTNNNFPSMDSSSRCRVHFLIEASDSIVYCNIFTYLNTVPVRSCANYHKTYHVRNAMDQRKCNVNQSNWFVVILLVEQQYKLARGLFHISVKF